MAWKRTSVRSRPGPPYFQILKDFPFSNLVAFGSKTFVPRVTSSKVGSSRSSALRASTVLWSLLHQFARVLAITFLSTMRTNLHWGSESRPRARPRSRYSAAIRTRLLETISALRLGIRRYGTVYMADTRLLPESVAAWRVRRLRATTSRSPQPPRPRHHLSRWEYRCPNRRIRGLRNRQCRAPSRGVASSIPFLLSFCARGRRSKPCWRQFGWEEMGAPFMRAKAMSSPLGSATATTTDFSVWAAFSRITSMILLASA
jgi:hypothetical protein